MTVYEQARVLYLTEFCPRTLDEDIHLHLLNPAGWVIKTPDVFAMGRPVISAGPARWVVDPSTRFSPYHCDCWHVYLVVGDISMAWNYLPYELPLISFERRNRLRFYQLARIKQKSNPSDCHDQFRYSIR